MARPARWGTRTLRASRSHARHDHKHDDHDARGHAGQIASRKVSQSPFLVSLDSAWDAELPTELRLTVIAELGRQVRCAWHPAGLECSRVTRRE